jgi:hypothetical protein
MAKNSVEAWFTAWNGIQIVNMFGPGVSLEVFAAQNSS